MAFYHPVAHPIVAEPQGSPQISFYQSGCQINDMASLLTLTGAGGLAGLLFLLTLWTSWRIRSLQRRCQQSSQQNQALSQQLRESLAIITKNNAHSDLTYAKSITLDYLQMRMDEEVFHYTVINQIQRYLTEWLNQSLNHVSNNALLIHEKRDIYYTIGSVEGQWHQVVLFRLHLQLAQLPTQASTKTVDQIVALIESFILQTEPPLSKLAINLAWKEDAHPIPELVLTQPLLVNIDFQQYLLTSLPTLIDKSDLPTHLSGLDEVTLP